LHLESVKYIVRAAVRNISGRRALAVYFYSREKAAAGRHVPEYVLFQCRDSYITLQHFADGSVKWRSSSLENLESHYINFTKTCAFYRLRDEQVITRFCGFADKAGLNALTSLQAGIMQERLNKRIKARERKIIERMTTVPPVPRGLKHWIHRDLLPHYIIYEYRSGKKPMSGYCTACRKDVLVNGAKHCATGKCPRCGKEVTFKASGRAQRIWDRGTAQVLSKIAPDEMALRIFKYSNGLRNCRNPDFSVWENARIFIRWDGAKQITFDSYYYSYSARMLTQWRQGVRPQRSYWQTFFENDLCGHLYCNTLSGALKDTPWQYSQMEQFYHTNREPMEVIPYLQKFINYPAIEYLMKFRLFQLVSDLVYMSSESKMLNADGMNLRDTLGIGLEDIRVLQEVNANAQQFWLYKKAYIPKPTFERLRDTLLDSSGAPYKNARNMAEALATIACRKYLFPFW
jgi:hypothetical protein